MVKLKMLSEAELKAMPPVDLSKYGAPKETPSEAELLKQPVTAAGPRLPR